MRALLDGSHVTRLELPLLDGGIEHAGVRSACSGTLSAKIAALDAATAEYDVLRLERRPPPMSFFKGNPTTAT